MKMTKVLIVGGAGYVGDCLTKVFEFSRSARQFDLTIYDNLLYEDRYLRSVPFVRGDVRDREKLLPLLKQSDIVIWLAAIVGDGACAVNPQVTMDVNLNAPKWMAQTFKGKIVFTSTCSVYGLNEEFLTEESPTKPLSLYAETKLKAETYILEHPDSTVFRLGTLYGCSGSYSRLRLDLVVNLLTYLATVGEPLKVFAGEQWRPLLHVTDVGSAILHACINDFAGLYNVSSENMRIADIAGAIAQEIPDTVINYADIPFEDKRNYKVSSQKMQNTGWEPYIDLKAGIRGIRDIIQQGRIKDPSLPVYSNVNQIRALQNAGLLEYMPAWSPKSIPAETTMAKTRNYQKTNHCPLWGNGTTKARPNRYCPFCVSFRLCGYQFGWAETLEKEEAFLVGADAGKGGSFPVVKRLE